MFKFGQEWPKAIHKCARFVSDFDWSVMEKAQYETYDTDEVYDTMELTSRENKVMCLWYTVFSINYKLI